MTTPSDEILLRYGAEKLSERAVKIKGWSFTSMPEEKKIELVYAPSESRLCWSADSLVANFGRHWPTPEWRPLEKTDVDWRFSASWSNALACSAIEFPERRIVSCGIDRALLGDKSRPILLFDEQELYSDDLGGLGDLQLTAKIRVSDAYFFILFRCVARVEGAGATVHETRVFHKFGDADEAYPIIFREETTRQSLSTSLASFSEIPLFGDPQFASVRVLPEVLLSVLRQVEYYFSDGNLPGDKFMQATLRSGGDGKVPIDVIARFNKMNKIFNKFKVDGEINSTLVAAIRLSSMLQLNESEGRVGRVDALPAADEADLQMRTVKVEFLPPGSTVSSVREVFLDCGEVRAVRMPAAGASQSVATKHGPRLPSAATGAYAEVEFATAGAALVAVKTKTDASNWRGGLRVSLSNGLSVPAATKLQAKKQPREKHEPPTTAPAESKGEQAQADLNPESLANPASRSSKAPKAAAKGGRQPLVMQSERQKPTFAGMEGAAASKPKPHRMAAGPDGTLGFKGGHRVVASLRESAVGEGPDAGP